MKQAKITVVGLGPGRFGLITLESWQLMQQAKNLVLRTRIHPTAEEIEKRGLTFSTYDGFYEEAPDFETLYTHIVKDLLHRAEKEGDIVYAVPGSPLVAERTVVLLREMAKESPVTVEILPGMSFVEVLYTRLGIDPIEGLTILDAEDVNTLKARPAQSLVITQVYDPIIASDTKLMLMDLYPDEYEVTYIHNLALPDESIRKIPLYELDRQKDVDHLTSLFIPAK
ncbi:SAM-dependent methyltransferase [Mitsuokella sp. WILCCON 0060]|uniref:SAM-dependent methyltransferase n=1 Tax=Mitsuokella sp. WILCCON 0060 TaxID=3345341 RepID=UPI003F1970CF